MQYRPAIPEHCGRSEAAIIVIFMCLAGSTSVSPGEGLQLRDVTDQTRITFTHTDGSSGQRYIVETVTGGVALFDYDGDGDEDIYFLNGAPLRGTRSGAPATNVLYRNDGDWRFTDVTLDAGVGDTGFGLGLAVADYDNDGHLDLYVNNYGPNVLYHNNGDGTFLDVTHAAGVSDGNKVGAGACFLDVDRDGDLDIYSANYVKFTYETHVARTLDGIPEYSGPKDYPAEPDTLFRNNGDGTFTDISDQSGIRADAGTGMGTVCADYDDDGDTDIFVLNDVAGNFFFENDGTGKFEELALMAGVAYNLHGHELGSMGVECGDYDNDGHLDFFMTSYAGQLPVLYRNLGDGFFEDVTLVSGAGAGTLPYVNWGAGMVDFDNDGDRDIFVANGHLQDNIELRDDTTAYLAPNTVLENTGRGKFVDVSKISGSGLEPRCSSRGAGFDDLDNDGDIDVVVLNSRREPTIIKNDTQGAGHWLRIRLVGVDTNRDGIGARVKVTVGNLVQIAEVHSGRGYQSHYGLRLHFGLKGYRRVDRLEVYWLGGGKDLVTDVATDQTMTIVQANSGKSAFQRN